MATSSVQIKQGSGQEEIQDDRQWEEECYQLGCAIARQEAIRRLEALEQRLHEQRPASWQDKGWVERTLVTRFGDIRIRRRLYRDEAGDYHIVLDEYLGWPKAQVATSSLMESLVELASQVPFRRVADTMAKLTAGVLSPTTIRRLVGRVAQNVLHEEKREWEACFEQGDVPSSAEKRVDRLYVEADGVWVHLQREDAPWYEVKHAMAYEGWQRLPQTAERYALVGKQVYCHGDDPLPFWEAASLEWSWQWDLSHVQQVIIGGDGASWIDTGVEWFPGAIRQRDGFHLARSCRWAGGREAGPAIYQAIREERWEEALRGLARAEPHAGERARKALQAVKRQGETGIDWRYRLEAVPAGARGLGTMESQEDKRLANRMKKRGMSWTIQGAQRMAKVIQVTANEEVRRWCERTSSPTVQGNRFLTTSRCHLPTTAEDDWFQAGLPAFVGPHASQLWVQQLRHVAHDTFPVT